MQSAAQYLDKTRSASRKLFEGIDTYLVLIRGHTATFVTSYTDEADWQRQYDSWHAKNQSGIQAALEAQREFLEEGFAQAALCGAVLQIAAKAIECYSKNTEVPPEWTTLIKPDSKPVPFCVGRQIRGVPLGLIVYAGRNQHTHFEDKNLREPNITVFEKLAFNHGYLKGQQTQVADPAFQLKTDGITSFANNITALIGWRSLEAYETDMRELLEI